MSTKLKRTLFVVLFILLFFAVRLHFYKTPLYGEEGIFAELVVNTPKSPEFHLAKRIDGQNIYRIPFHPHALYHSIRFAGVLASPLIDSVSWQDDAQIAPILRFVFSLFQFVMMLAVALFLCIKRGPVNFLLLALFIAVVISPISIVTSINLQVDGSIGVVMTGVFAIALLFLLSGNPNSVIARAGLFIASVVLGTGKQEWSMVLLIAMLGAGTHLFITRKSNPVKPNLSILLIALTGLTAGHIFSYFLEPTAYIGGYRVFWRFSGIEKVIDGGGELNRFIKLTWDRKRWLATAIPLALAVMVLVLKKVKQLKPLESMLCLFGLGLFGAYFISTWNSEPRYFMPSVFVMTVAIIAVLPDKTDKKVTVPIGIIVLLMYAANGIFLFNNIVKKPIKPYFDTSTVNLKPNQVAMLASGDVWNKLDIDFVRNSIGKSDAEFQAKRHNKELWYPESNVKETLTQHDP